MALSFVLMTAGCRADSIDGIISKVDELDRNQDGKPELRVETFFRDGRKVMTQLSRTNLQGELVTVTWGLFVGGRLVATDSDEDADGHFETIMVMRPDSTDLEVFVRGIDGSVQPAGANIVAAHQKQSAAFAEFFGRAVAEGLKDGQGRQLVEETRGRLVGAELEKQGSGAIAESAGGEFTTKVFERDRDNDGRPDFRMERVFRNGEMVMTIKSTSDSTGGMSVESRGYYVKDELIAAESDDNRDGVFESIVIYQREMDELEAFTRGADGSVRPVGAKTLRALQKQHEVIAELFDRAFADDVDLDQGMKLFEEARVKILAAEQEKE